MRHWLSLALVAVCASFALAGEDASSPLTEEDRADLAFFERLGLPDVADLPFVEARTGEGWEDAEGELPVATVQGFLLRTDEDGTFVVWTGEPFPRTYRATEPDISAGQQVSYRDLDFAEVVRVRLAGRDEPRELDEFGERLDGQFAQRLSPCGRVLALAWACSRRGLEAQTHLLLERARKRVGGPLRETCFDQLAEHVIWRVVEAFGDPAISRPRLRSAFQRFLETFPSSEEHAKTAREAEALLTRMVEEDARHARSKRPIAAMRKDERIAEWIFRLRDQNGHQTMQPGGPSIFATLEPEDDSPAHQLVAIGYDAIPRLIEALGDKRFTRTVGFWRDFTYSHYVVRVGGAARSILQHITGLEFEDQAKWRAWWTAFAKEGLVAGLEGEVRGGGPGAIDAARSLAKRGSVNALPAILEGIENAEGEHTREYLISILATLPGEEQLAFMRQELRAGPTRHGRLRAARWLTEHGHPEGLDAVTEEWESLQRREDPDAQAVVPVALFFLIVGTEEAMRTLVEGLPSLPVAMRGRVLDRLYVGRTRSENWPPASPEGEALLLETLVAALEDESTYPPTDLGDRPPDDDTMRICEAAARRLAFIWREEGVNYVQGAFRADRDRQIRAVRNHARAKAGRPPLPEPPPPEGPLLGNRVREVRLRPEGVELGFAVTRAVVDLGGEEVTAADFAALVDAAVGARPEGSSGLEAVLWRPDDGTGIVLTFTVLATGNGSAPTTAPWELAVTLHVGRARKIDETSSVPPGGKRAAPSVAEHTEFVAALARALARPPEIALRAVVRLRRTNQ